MALFIAVILTAFATLANSGAVYPYDIERFGLAVTVIFCIFLGRGIAALINAIQGIPFRGPTEYLEQPRTRAILGLAITLLLISSLVGQLIAVPWFTDGTLESR